MYQAAGRGGPAWQGESPAEQEPPRVKSEVTRHRGHATFLPPHPTPPPAGIAINRELVPPNQNLVFWTVATYQLHRVDWFAPCPSSDPLGLGLLVGQAGFSPLLYAPRVDPGCMSPDVKNSIHVGDRILEINGTPIRNVPLDEVWHLG